MNKFARISILLLFAAFVCTSCEKDEKFVSSLIEGLTLDNYPIVDGSTSTMPLNITIVCELLGIEYGSYRNVDDDTWGIKPDLNKRTLQKFDEKIKSSQTHQSFINLIDRKADVILTARKMSPDEKAYADAAGVSLIEFPIALDAFVFLVNPYNPVKSLTIEQIQGIYTGKITHWKEVGGEMEEMMATAMRYGKINPYVRNANSGSQELMDELVMNGLDMMELPTASELLIHTMAGVRNIVTDDVNAICYSVYYYMEYMTKMLSRLCIAVEGVAPNSMTLGNRTYPYVTEVYAVIRSDLSESSMAYKVYEFLQTTKGRAVIRKSGYLPHY